MKIAILSRDPSLYSTQRLIQACEKRGHEVVILDPLLCFIDISSEGHNIYYKGEIIEGVGAVIPRFSAAFTSYGNVILRQFEMMGAYPLNESVAVARARDKLRSLQILSKHGIGMPKSTFAHSTKMTDQLIELVGGAPLIVKLLEGSQGRGVVLCDTNKASESVIDALREINANFLVQEFIKEAAGKDIRCFVIGDKVVATMMRVAKKGEFRSNLHRGGTAKKITITQKEREIAIAATQALGLSVSGVDIIRSKRGPIILEVNSSPGLEGIEGITKKDIAGMIVKFIEANAKSNKVRSKGRG